MDYQKISGQGFNLHLIEKKLTKRNIVEIRLADKIKYDDITKRYFLNEYLISITNNYPTERLLSIKTEDLYNVHLGSTIERIGNISLFVIGISFLNERYTEKGMTDQTIKFLKEIVYNCNFNEEQFKVIKKRIIEEIKDEEESKKYKATISLKEAMDKNSPFAFRRVYLKQLNSLTLQDIKDYYQQVISESDINIYAVGDFSFTAFSKKILKNFSFPSKPKLFKNNCLIHNKFRLLSKKVMKKDKVNQSILKIGFKLKDLNLFEQEYVMPIYNEILGGGSNSKLFNEVREKHSLAYYSSSLYSPYDNVLYISSGISKENYRLTKKLISKIINDLQQGKFTEEDITSAKNNMINRFNMNRKESSFLISRQVLKQYYKAKDIDEVIKQIKKVTKKQIIDASKKIKLDTIYFLYGGESNETD